MTGCVRSLVRFDCCNYCRFGSYSVIIVSSYLSFYEISISPPKLQATVPRARKLFVADLQLIPALVGHLKSEGDSGCVREAFSSLRVKTVALLKEILMSLICVLFLCRDVRQTLAVWALSNLGLEGETALQKIVDAGAVSPCLTLLAEYDFYVGFGCTCSRILPLSSISLCEVFFLTLPLFSLLLLVAFAARIDLINCRKLWHWLPDLR